ncbi:MAG: S1 RNA-binding domain-containing protein, partial [Bacilli bacterium]
MTNTYEVGQIVRGKVTGIQRYGAFVSFEGTKQGLIHISEITDGFVRDIGDFISSGDLIRVKILSIDELTGKMSLSLKATHQGEDRHVQPTRKHHVMSIPRTCPDGF